jgi:RNA polymerase sigma factor (sigma-70 family)
VHDLIERQHLDSLGDFDLVQQFLSSQSEDAFAALVRRHGPMVLGTCRRVLQHTQDAEDACQATFLILARKARTIRGDAIGAWLHRVAVRISLRLVNDSARRSTQKLPDELLDQSSSSDDLTLKEVIAAFDEEVARLPRRFRLPLVLCCLQGLTRDETARILGWTQGAVRGRLERGRKLLQERFIRRGLTLTAGMFAAIVEQSATSTGAASPSAPTTIARGLAESVLRSMAIARMKVAACSVAAMLLIGTVAGIGFFHPVAAQPKPADTSSPTSPPAPSPSPAIADAEKNLDTFVLRLSLAPQGEGKFDPNYALYNVLLYVPNLRLEPPANGPTGKPMEAHARITKEQAKKIVAALKDNRFFGEQDVGMGPRALRDKNGPHATIVLRYQNGEDPTRREIVYPWRTEMLKPFDAVRACVDGDAAKALDQLIGQLSEERKKWTPDLIADLKKMQGTWTPGPDKVEALGGIAANKQTMKCVIDGNTITLKPQIKLDPLMDLEIIRGTFELSHAGGQRLMTIQGERDTISKVEKGTWTLHYDVTDTTLMLLLPPVGKTPPADGKPRYEQGDRQFILKRQPTGVASEWGEASLGLRARIRTAKLKYTVGDNATIDLDIRDSLPGVAGQARSFHGIRAQVARMEINGVRYVTMHHAALKKLATFALKGGESAEPWISATLSNDTWIPEDSLDKDGLTRPLEFKPGKYKVRLGHEFLTNQDKQQLAVPMSGTLEIEFVAPDEKTKGASSGWGGPPSDGLIACISTPRAKVRVGEPIELRYDVAGFGNGNRTWTAASGGQYARVEVDGVWYVYKFDTFEKMTKKSLIAGRTFEGWTTIKLDANWVAESTLKKTPMRELALRPGKHSIRVAYDFSSDSSKASTGQPTTGLLEIEVLTEEGKAAEPVEGWRPNKYWTFGVKGMRDMVMSADGTRIAATDGKELIVWTITRDQLKELERCNIESMGLLCFDAAGSLILLKHSPIHRISDFRSRPIDVRTGNVMKWQPTTIIECDHYVRVAVKGHTIAYVLQGWDKVHLVGEPLTADSNFDAPKGKPESIGAPHRLVFSEDGKTLFGLGAKGSLRSESPNGAVVAWNVSTKAVRWEHPGSDKTQVVDIAKDGSTIVIGEYSGDDVLVLDGATGKPRFREIIHRLAGLNVSPDGKLVAITSFERGKSTMPKLAMFDANRGTLISEMPTAGILRGIEIDPKGRGFVAIDSIGQLQWWDRVATGR